MDSSWSVRELCRHHCRHHHHRWTVDHYFFSCFWLTFHMDGMDFLCLLFSVLWWNSTSVVNYTDLQLLSAVLQCSLVLLHLSDVSEWVTAAGLPSLVSMGPPVPLSCIVCLVSCHTCVLSNRSAIVALLWYPLSVCECEYVLMPLCVLTPPAPKGGTSSAIGLVSILV